jgi:methionyl-tRNA formyltransferase
MVDSFVVATEKSWNIANFKKLKLDGDWHLITTPREFGIVKEIKPKYIFVPHWSWFIPKDIYENHSTVIFHMTDLPFGRGAEPLQHLISRGLTETMVSAIQCNQEVDSGKIYLKRPLSLYGSAEEIYIRCSNIVFDMIKEIVKNNLEATQEQIGNPTYFMKRCLKDCQIPDVKNLPQIYDWIRMQDAETYDFAYLETNSLKLEFSRASLRNGYIEANVKIRIKE